MEKEKREDWRQKLFIKKNKKGAWKIFKKYFSKPIKKG